MKTLIILLNIFVMNIFALYSQDTSDLIIQAKSDNVFPKETSDNSTHNKNDTLKDFKKANNSIYLELLGNAPLYSLNYERIFFHKNKFYLSGRIGLGYLIYEYDHNNSSNNIVGIPALIKGDYKLSNKLFIETGIGASYIYQREIVNINYPSDKETSIDNIFAATALVGLRIKTSKSFLFSIGFTPLFFIKNSIFMPIGGMSFGYSF